MNLITSLWLYKKVFLFLGNIHEDTLKDYNICNLQIGQQKICTHTHTHTRKHMHREQMIKQMGSNVSNR